MNLTRLFSVIVTACCLGGLALFANGCVMVTAGSASAAYIRGELHATLNQPLEATARAANQALTQLQLVKVSEKKDAFVAILGARTAEDKKVEIRLSQLTADSTTVQIRVGLFGDEIKSMAILDKIKANL